jgi:hypothetical protein
MTDNIKHHEIDLTLTRGEWKMMGFREHDGCIVSDQCAPDVSTEVRNACLLLAAASDQPAATYVAAIAKYYYVAEACRVVQELASSIEGWKANGSKFPGEA